MMLALRVALAASFALLAAGSSFAQTAREFGRLRSTITPASALGPGAASTTPPAGPAARQGQRRFVRLTGYWPPTNEAVRRFSPKPSLNPVWEGEDWMGRGYDVVSFFPVFPNPSCFSCGQGSGDLEVDYEDTAEDFARICAAYEPVAIITFSRGFPDRSWEVEAAQFNRSQWIPDFTAPFFPVPSPPDAGVDPGAIRYSTLPVEAIVQAVAASPINVSPAVCYTEGGGGYLSEFIAYLGVWYQANHADPARADRCVAAGHVHVGGQVSWADASAAVDVTLTTVLDYVDGVLGCPPMETYCPGQPNSEFREAVLTPIGAPSLAGGELMLLVQRMPPGQSSLLYCGPGSAAPTPLGDGVLCVTSPLIRLPMVVNADVNGIARFPLDYTVPQFASVSAGSTVTFQAWYRDAAGPVGSNTSTATLVTFCP